MSPDPKISDLGTSDEVAYAVAVQSNGKIVLAGNSIKDGNHDFALVRYTATGAIDTTFGAGTGKVIAPVGSGHDYVRGMALQSDGKMVVVGYSNNGTEQDDFAVVRFIGDSAFTD